MPKRMKIIYVMLSVFVFLGLSISSFGYNPPNLNQPTDNYQCVSITPIFSWYAAANAVSYRLQVSTQQSFITTLVDVPNITGLYYIPQSLEYNSTYYWRVIATFPDNSQQISLIRSFKTKKAPPVLLAPDNQSTCHPLTIEFEWQALEDAEDYIIEIFETSSSETPMIYQIINTTSATLTLPDSSHTYYWRILSNLSECDIDSSAFWNFTTFPKAPVLEYPENNATCLPLDITFAWEDFTNVGNYWLQVSETENFSSFTVNNNNILNNHYSFTLPKYNTVYYWRVSSSFTTCKSQWSKIYSFSTLGPVPTLEYPANNANAAPVNTYFAITANPPADYYQFEISTDKDFDPQFTLVKSEHLSMTFTPTTLLKSNTVYYWRANSTYVPCTTDMSATFTFKTQYTKPTLLQPLANETCVPINAIFQWQAIQGAEKYRIQIATDNNFSNIVTNTAEISNTVVNITLPDGLTDYYWRVRAEDTKNLSDWSDVLKFSSTLKPPAILLPVDNTGGFQKDLVLSWASLGSNAKYNVQVSRLSDFSTLIVDENNLTNTSLSITVPNHYTYYYWRIAAIIDDCESQWSDTWKFRTILDAPELIAPKDLDNKIPQVVEFSWKPINGAITYNLYIYNTPKLDKSSEVYSISSIPASTIQVLLKPDSTYWWRVNAVNDEGISEFSQVRSFSTNGNSPSTPILILPKHKDVSVAVPVVFTWEASSNTDRYHIQIADMNSFISPIVSDDNVSSTSFTFDHPEYYKEYFWRVQAINDASNSNWSEVRKFRTIALKPDDKPILVYPPNEEDSVEIDIQFTWQPVERAIQYEFQLSKNIDFSESNIVKEELYIYNNTAIANKLELGKDYWWRVLAKNDGGSSQWSDIWHFKTNYTTSIIDDKLINKYNVCIYPNPMQNTATFNFDLDQTKYVLITIWDLNGNQIATVSNSVLEAGKYSIAWDSANNPAGVYIYSIQFDNQIINDRIVIIK